MLHLDCSLGCLIIVVVGGGVVAVVVDVLRKASPYTEAPAVSRSHKTSQDVASLGRALVIRNTSCSRELF